MVAYLVSGVVDDGIPVGVLEGEERLRRGQFAPVLSQEGHKVNKNIDINSSDILLPFPAVFLPHSSSFAVLHAPSSLYLLHSSYLLLQFCRLLLFHSCLHRFTQDSEISF
jgi:hypothetical protein